MRKSGATWRSASRLAMIAAIGGMLAAGGPLGVSYAARGGHQPARMSALTEKGSMARYAGLPLNFEPNRGQTGGQVRFLAHIAGGTVFFRANDAVLVRSTPGGSDAILHMGLVGAARHPRIEAVGKLPGRVSYYIGSAKQWHTDIATFSRLVYHDVYPGIDLVFHGTRGALEYDFKLKPGANPDSIRLHFGGASRLTIDPRGNLITAVSGTRVVQAPPSIYQWYGGAKHTVSGHFVLSHSGTVRFAVGPHDAGRSLVIDPTLSYSTYLGGSNEDYGYADALDSAGDVYIAGGTKSTNFPGAGTGGTLNCFVSEMNPTGSALVYSLYLGGGGNDQCNAIAIDSAGNAYVTGETKGSGGAHPFPTLYPYQSVSAGGYDSFVTKFAPGGVMVYSTYLGGSADDEGQGIAVDASGNAFVAGWTNSTNFPTANAHQAANAGLEDATVSEISFNSTTDVMSLTYSTYLGGSSYDQAYAIALDSSDNAYVAGYSDSTNFPVTPGAFQTIHGNGSGYANGFITKLTPAGNVLSYSTYLGGSIFPVGVGDFIYGIAVDSGGNVYVTGDEASTNFPTKNPFQAAQAGSDDAFVSKLNATGSALVYSTYLGGSNYDFGTAIALDAAGDAYVTGQTFSTNFPKKNPLQSALKGKDDAFIAIMSATGTTQVFSTYLGGSVEDKGNGIAVDAGSNFYVTGQTDSTNFPVVSPFQPANGGGGLYDAFVTKGHS